MQETFIIKFKETEVRGQKNTGETWPFLNLSCITDTDLAAEVPWNKSMSSVKKKIVIF